MKKKVLSVLLTLAMLLSLLPIQVLAASAPVADQTPGETNTEVSNAPDIAPVSAPDNDIMPIGADDSYTLRCDTDLIVNQKVTQIEFTITSTNGAFKSGLNNASLFHLTNVGLEATSVVTLGEDRRSITLGVSGTLTQAGTYTITVDAQAFEVPPKENVGVEVTVKSSPKVESKTTLTAGKDASVIELKVTEASFVESNNASGFEISGIDGLNLNSVSAKDDTATLTVSGVPAAAGTLTVTIQPEAFNPPAGKAVTAKVTVDPASGSVKAEFTAPVYAGTAVSGQRIKITADGLIFIAEPIVSNFTLGNGHDNLTVTGVERTGDNTVELELNGMPQNAGSFKITVNVDAFKYKPAEAVITADAISITAAPDGNGKVTATFEGTLTAGTAVKSGTITLKIADEFALTYGSSDGGDYQKNFELKNDEFEGLTLDSVITDGKTATLKFSGTPKAAGDTTFTVTIQKDAFIPRTSGPVTATAAAVNVKYPSITMTATPNPATAGDTSEFILTISGGELQGDITNHISFEGTSSDGVKVQSATYEVNTITLVLTEPLAVDGQLTIKIAKEAFKYQPKDDVTVDVTVNAPTGKVEISNADPLYVGTPVDGLTITLEATGLTFNTIINNSNSYFGLTGAGSTSLIIEGANGSGNSVTLTLSGTPTEGKVQVTIQKEAFKYQPAEQITSTNESAITVQAAPDGNGIVTATCGETLTAGTAVGSGTITLTISDDSVLTFDAIEDESYEGKFGLSSTGFDELTLTNVTAKGKAATLTFSGTPNKGGDVSITVTIDKDAFIPHASGDVSAIAKISVGYPDIKMTVDPASIVEGKADSVTLKLEGGLFTADPTDYISVSSNEITDIKVKSVTATAGSAEATLTLSATPTHIGTVTVTAQTGAFQYQPSDMVTTTFTVTAPPTTLEATECTLVAGTEGGTITITETEAEGDHFEPNKEQSLDNFSFEDTGNAVYFSNSLPT